MILILSFILVFFGVSLFSLLLLFKWKYLANFTLLNISIIFIYIFSLYFFEDDTSNFRFYFKVLTYLTIHSLVIFIYSIYNFFTRKKDERKT